jgi:hypothetical protein
MLKAVVIALLLANLAFFAWTEGWLDAVVGVRAIGDREPERLARQVRPEAIRIVSPAAPAASAPVTAAATCLEAGPFTAAELVGAEASLRSTWPAAPDGAWSAVKTDQPGTWIVYMGRYPNRETLNRKRIELARRNVPFDEVNSPAALESGLSLGRFDARAGAVQALEQFVRQGIRSARVVELTAPASSYRLRVEPVDAALALLLAGPQVDAPLARPFIACTTRPAAN